MTTRSIRSVALVIWLAAVSIPSVAADLEPPSKLFDGTPKVVLVNGYSAFRHWPSINQRQLDRYFEGKMIEIRSAIKGSAPIARWIEVETGDRLAQNETIDWDKARALRGRMLAGEKLSSEERAYLERAMTLRRERLDARQQQTGRPEPKQSTGLTPLTDMSAEDRYKGQDGGLYGGGRNEPPKAHLGAALHEARRIRPLDSEGKPSEDGKIVLISNGMSNTTQEFQAFLRLANDDPQKSRSVVIVDGAQGGMEASDWAHPEKQFRTDRANPWDVLDQRLRQAGVTPRQVQVVWIKQARRNPASLGEFPQHAEELKGNLVAVLQKLKERFPNLRLAYLSSRIYAGYATTPLNPEPYAYESAFAVRWLVQDQITGKPDLNYDPEQGDVQAPFVLWGPYLWADGTGGRKLDDLVWKRDDLAGDGTHPSPSGRQEVAELLLTFFKTDPTAKLWFVRPEGD